MTTSPTNPPTYKQVLAAIRGAEDAVRQRRHEARLRPDEMDAMNGAQRLLSQAVTAVEQARDLAKAAKKATS